MSMYSEADFREAHFARTEDGLVAMRAFPGEYQSWIFVTTKGTTALRTDSSMPREDWIPVTGRTITESQVEAIGRDAINYFTPGGTWADWARAVFKSADFPVVPDPDPTEAEKLAEIIDGHINPDGITPESLAEYLVAHGVTAPGDDDE